MAVAKIGKVLADMIIEPYLKRYIPTNIKQDENKKNKSKLVFCDPNLTTRTANWQQSKEIPIS